MRLSRDGHPPVTLMRQQPSVTRVFEQRVSQGGRSAGIAQTDDFAALVRRLRSPLLRFFARRTGSSTDAEEMVQDLFVRLLRRADLLTLDNVDGYVFEAAANVARDRGRYELSRGSGLHVDIETLSAESDEPGQERVVAGRQGLTRMLAALNALPPRARTIVILRRFENLTYAQISDRLGISVSAVEKHMVRSMSALRVDLGHGTGKTGD